MDSRDVRAVAGCQLRRRQGPLSPGSQKRVLAGIILLVGGVLAGCAREYDKTSVEGYRLARTLYNVCNLEKSEQLGELRSIIQSRRAAGEIGAGEHEALLGILECADAGNWDEAQQQTRRLLADQVDR